MRTSLAAKYRVPPATEIRSASSSNGRIKAALDLKRIMVPVDFSCCSRKALQYAVSLAHEHGAGIVLINVLEQNPTARIIRQRHELLKALADQEGHGLVPVTTLVKSGEPLREIVATAKAELVDLLLISTHARGYLPDFCLGSAAEQIVRYAPCPVLVVREQERDFLRPVTTRHIVNRSKTKKAHKAPMCPAN